MLMALQQSLLGYYVSAILIGLSPSKNEIAFRLKPYVFHLLGIFVSQINEAEIFCVNVSEDRDGPKGEFLWQT